MRVRMASGAALLLFVCALSGIFLAAGCRDKANTGTGGDSGAATAAGAGALGAASSDAHGPEDSGFDVRAASDGGRARPSAEPTNDARAYLAALAAGRSAALAKKYDEARSAFDHALALRPDDARALAERGNAELLAEDLDRAEADFQRALAGTLDTKLAAATHFNHGLLLEKRGKKDDALVAFGLADTLETTPARHAKVKGSPCTADLSLPPTNVESYGSWNALARAVNPKTDLGGAQKSVCVDDTCSGKPPWTVFHDHQDNFEDEWIVWTLRHDLLVVHVGMVGAWPARCVNVPRVDANRVDGLVHLSTTFDGVAAELDDATSAAPGTCRDVLGWKEEEWFDKERSLLRIRTFKNVPAPKVAVQRAAIVVSGAGCDREVAREVLPP